MVKRARDHTFVAEEIAHEVSRTRSTRLRSSNNAHVSTTADSSVHRSRSGRTVQTASSNPNLRQRSDCSSEGERRKRPRNTEMHTYGDRRNTETGINSARESRNNRSSAGLAADAHTMTRSESNLPTAGGSRRCNIDPLKLSQDDISVTEDNNPIGRSVKLFVQAKTATQGMKSLMSENEQLFQEFKDFLIVNLPDKGPPPEGATLSTRGDEKVSPPLVKLSVGVNTCATIPSDFVNESAIEWTDDLKSSLKCTICQELCHRCVTSCPCFHTFCGGCLSMWFERCGTRKTCPTCREAISSVSKNLHAEQLLKSYFASFPTQRRSQTELNELQTKDRLYCANVVLLNDNSSSSNARRRRYAGHSASNGVPVALSDILSNVDTDDSQDNGETSAFETSTADNEEPNSLEHRFFSVNDPTDTELGGSSFHFGRLVNRSSRVESTTRPATSRTDRNAMQSTFNAPQNQRNDNDFGTQFLLSPLRVRSLDAVTNRMANYGGIRDDTLTLSEASAEIVSSFLDQSEEESETGEETTGPEAMTSAAPSAADTQPITSRRRSSPRPFPTESRTRRSDRTNPNRREYVSSSRRPRVRGLAVRRRGGGVVRGVRSNRRNRQQETVSSTTGNHEVNQHNYARDEGSDTENGSDSNYETRINVAYELNSYSSDDGSNSSSSDTESSLNFSDYQATNNDGTNAVA